MTVLRGLIALIVAFAAILCGLVAVVLAACAVVTALIAARVERAHPPVGRFVEVAGGRLSVVEAGPERAARGTVVLLHGASASASDPMEGIGRKLAEKGFRVLAFDRPGFGWSDRLVGEEAATPAFQAAAIGEALDRMGVGPAIVFGHSWAGALALRMALDRPAQVAGLVLAAPVALPFEERRPSWWVRLAFQPTILRLLVSTIGVPIGQYYLPKAAGAAFRPEPMPADYIARSRAELILRPGPALANFQDLVALPAALKQQAPRYAEIRVPTLVAAGDADPVVTTALQAAPLAQRIADARLVRLPGVGHMLHYTAPDALVSEIEALQSRIDASAQR